MKKSLFTLFTAFLLLTVSVSTGEENPVLEFLISDKNEKSMNLYELENRLDTSTVRIKDPIYGKEKRYKAFVLKEVLDLAYGEKWRDDKFTDISFYARDGYEAVAETSKLKQDGGYLVFRDLEYENWEPIGERKADPSPFYIVWKGNDQKTENGYPWPWQLEKINLILFRDKYSEVYPDGIAKDSPAYRGFEIFKQRCIRCHSINRQGGKVGPDLNAPMNVLEYRPANMVKEFIKHPSKYRHTYMPDNPDLSDEQLHNIVDYLWHIKEDGQ